MAGDMEMSGTVTHYSPVTGLIYIFNLIVGTGALTLPAAFMDAGWFLSSIIIIILAFMSYLTATFVIESMASTNAMIHWKRLQRIKRSGGSVSEELVTRTVLQVQAQNVGRRPSADENAPLINEETVERVQQSVSSYYEITEITEMGKMASVFFSQTGRNMFYLCLAIYLYGDLAIYAAAIAKSIRDVACTYKPPNITSPLNISESEICWDGSSQSRLDAYRIFLAVFVCTIGQFVFCNVTKTKYLQMVTTLMRWQAFLIMVILATIRLSNIAPATPPSSSISGLPNLFGVCVYSFMCHHSLPGLVTPISNKKNLYSFMLGDYCLILAFYFLLAYTGIFAFTEINDLYTLNFQPSSSDSWFLFSLHIFLALFPVFTLSTNFPIIAITLSNNLKSLFLTDGRRYSYWTRKALFPLLALAPPTVIAMATHSLEFLVGITGSYAGAGIQYVVPAALVYQSRLQAGSALGVGVTNHYKSPFRHTMWVVFVQLWAVTCIVFVTWNHISDALS